MKCSGLLQSWKIYNNADEQNLVSLIQARIMATWEKYLHDIYYDPKHPSSFGGVNKLYKAALKDGRRDITKSRVKNFLSQQETYSMHKAVNNAFRRNKVLVTGKDDQWEMDLMDMASYAKFNDNVRYVLLAIDVFSKFVWLRPLKNKTGVQVRQAIDDILLQGRKARRIRTDNGSEFLAKTVQDMLKSSGIEHFTSQNEVKANFAERAIKTIKAKIQRYMTFKQTFRYIDQLQDMASSYNSSHHRSIHMSPNEVTERNQATVWKNLYWPTSSKHVSPQKFRYNVGDHVRLSYLRRAFQREYDQKWTGEIFKVSRRYRRGGLSIYKLVDFNGDDIKGTFYQDELQKVTIKDGQLWKIDKILKQRKKRNSTEYLVKWLYWPPSFNSWVDAKDIVDI